MAVPVLQITALTHRGRVRDTNEDTIAVDRWVRNEPMTIPSQWLFAMEQPVACIVADGMGGHAAGEVASQYVATRLGSELQQLGDPQQIITLLLRINGEIYDLMARDPSHVGMGSTVVGLVLNQNRLIWFNIGDSRLYEDRNGFLHQISIDDVPEATVGRDLIAGYTGGLITQSLGGSISQQPPIPHVGVVNDIVPSRWLLCSDGLTNMLDLETMQSCMATSDLEAIIQLTDAANEAGGEDNASIIILTIAFEETLELR